MLAIPYLILTLLLLFKLDALRVNSIILYCLLGINFFIEALRWNTGVDWQAYLYHYQYMNIYFL